MQREPEAEPPIGVEAEPRVAHTSAHIEWSLVLDRIAERATSEVSALRIRALLPETTLEPAHARTRVVSEALTLIQRGGTLPARRIADLDELWARARRGALPSAVELWGVLEMLEVAAVLRAFAAEQRDDFPALSAALDSERRLDKLRTLLGESIGKGGIVLDSASPELRKARGRMRDAKRDLSTRLSELGERYKDVLRDQQVVERDGRFALPVRSDAHVRVDGSVLGASASGGTLYVEPQELVPVSNRLRLAEAAAEREEARVVAELGARVATDLTPLEAAYEACVQAGVVAAITSWAGATEAIAVFVEDKPVLELRAARHPLLVGTVGEVVPNDVVLRHASALIISGPNAGGKTVALKCAGLFAWLARTGLPICAAPGSRVGWFSPVLTDIGDEQSLVLSLSTFSGHVQNLSEILQASDDRTLVLLDELAAGTDPEEGAALAASVLEALAQRGATIAVTTHYERLKELAADHPQLSNASVGFDFDRMAPTFKLVLGIPGPSSALAVAARHGMPREVLERAQALLSQTSLERENLVQKLQAETAALEALRRQEEAESRRQDARRLELEREHERAAKGQRAELEREARALLDRVKKARAELDAAETRLRRDTLSRETLREAERTVSSAASAVALGTPLAGLIRGSTDEAGAGAIDLKALTVGAIVFLPKLGISAEVVENPGKDQVRVQAGSLKLWVKTDDLQASSRRAARAKAAEPKTKTKTKTQHAAPPIRPTPVRSVDNTLDLRGQRVDDAIDRIEAFIDRMMSGGEPAGFVLHGHGTGALKSAVREHLAAHRFVDRARAADPDDGGDAFTVFYMKD